MAYQSDCCPFSRCLTYACIAGVLCLLVGCGSSSIFSLSSDGDLNGVRGLLESDPSLVGAADEEGRTPIHWAAMEGRTEIVKLLIERGADTSLHDDLGFDALCYAKNHGHEDTAGILIASMGIHVAARSGAASVVKDLLGQNPGCANERDDSGRTPIYYAILGGHRETAEALLSGGARVGETWDGGSSPLHLAAFVGEEDIAWLLLQNGAAPSVRDGEGRTPSYWARKHGHEATARLLEDSAGFHEALSSGDTSAMQTLLERNPRVAVTKDEEGRNPLHSAIRQGCVDIADLLIQHDADVNCVYEGGLTPLQLASMKGMTRTAGLLIDKGADINAESEKARTALYWAIKHGHEETASILRANGAVIAGGTETPAHVATREGNLGELKALLVEDTSRVNSRDGMGRTPLHLAAYEGGLEIARFLIENGADKNALDDMGKTAAYWARLQKHAGLEELLGPREVMAESQGPESM